MLMMKIPSVSATAAFIFILFIGGSRISADYFDTVPGDLPPFGGALLNEALNYVLQPGAPTVNSNIDTIKRNIASALPLSNIRIRCLDYLACEYLLPAVEIDNAIFFNGILYLNNIDKKNEKTLSDINKLYGAKQGYLPSNMVQYGPDIHWLHGPKIVLYDERNPETFPGGKKLECAKIWNTSAYFLHPWEAGNAFHSLNDNVLSVLASMVVQHITPPTGGPAAVNAEGYKTLYLFKRMVTTKDTKSSMLYNLIYWLFEGDVRPAKSLLQGGPHCVRHVTWSTSMKPFYRDSLLSLRATLYSIFQRALRMSPQYPAHPAPELRVLRERKQGLGQGLRQESIMSSINSYITGNGGGDPSRSLTPRVVIVSRNLTGMPNDPTRKLARESELALVKEFNKRGAKAVMCCDYKYVNTIPKLFSYFGYADICVGIHGAGLSNCMLGMEGQVIVEFQGGHAHGFDSFMKMAHMAGGSYVHMDIRRNRKHMGMGPGSFLESRDVLDVVNTSLALYWQSKTPNKEVDPDHPMPERSRLTVFKSPDKIIPQHIEVNSLQHQVIRNSSIDIKALLGPLMLEHTPHCKSLPYFEFRGMVMSSRDHRDRCDKDIVRKATGAIDGKLLTAFV